MNIYACRLYNKVLTSEEIKNNYNKTVEYRKMLMAQQQFFLIGDGSFREKNRPQSEMSQKEPVPMGTLEISIDKSLKTL